MSYREFKGGGIKTGIDAGNSTDHELEGTESIIKITIFKK